MTQEDYQDLLSLAERGYAAEVAGLIQQRGSSDNVAAITARFNELKAAVEAELKEPE